MRQHGERLTCESGLHDALPLSPLPTANEQLKIRFERDRIQA